MPVPWAEPLPHLLFWQPSASGQQALQQFLRLHAAGQWLRAGEPVSTAAPAQALARGEGVDIAGHHLSAALAADLREARLTPPALLPGAAPAPRLVWIDSTPQGPAPQTRTRTHQATVPPQPAPHQPPGLQAWRDAGWQVQALSVPGPAFWQSVGLAEAPALLQATTAALCAPAPSEAPAEPAAEPQLEHPAHPPPQRPVHHPAHTPAP